MSYRPYPFPVSTRHQWALRLPPEACLERLLALNERNPSIQLKPIDRQQYSVVLALTGVNQRAIPLIRPLTRIHGEVLIQRQIRGGTEVSCFVLHRAPTIITAWLMFTMMVGTMIVLAVLFTNMWRSSLAILYLVAFFLFNRWLIIELRNERQQMVNLIKAGLETEPDMVDVSGG